MRRLAGCIASLLDSPEDEAVRENARDLVQGLCREFPLYEEAAEIADA